MPTVVALAISVPMAYPGYAASESPPEPPEFITNGTFAVDASWTKGSGWTISGGAAHCSGSAGALSQNFGALIAALTSGNDYVLTFDLSGSTGATRVALSGDGTQVLGSTFDNGTVVVPFTAGGNLTTISFSDFDESPITIDNVSLVPAP